MDYGFAENLDFGVRRRRRTPLRRRRTPVRRRRTPVRRRTPDRRRTRHLPGYISDKKLREMASESGVSIYTKDSALRKRPKLVKRSTLIKRLRDAGLFFYKRQKGDTIGDLIGMSLDPHAQTLPQPIMPSDSDTDFKQNLMDMLQQIQPGDESSDKPSDTPIMPEGNPSEVVDQLMANFGRRYKRRKSPKRRRTPVRRKSPKRRRTPVRRKSPKRRRTPVRRKSPKRRRTPVRRR